MKIRDLLILSCLLGGPALVVSAQTVHTPLSFKLETGFNYSRGDYGLPQDTTVWAVPVSLSYESNGWTVRGTLPWINIEGPATVIGNVEVPVRPNAGRESGFGDFVASLAYKIPADADQLQVIVSGRVKVPTGNEDRGLSTGETDYYAQLDLLRTFGRVTPFLTAGYRWLGRNTTYQLEDGVYASGGLAVNVATGTSVGVAYEWRQRIVAGADSSNEVSVFFFKQLNEHWGINLSALKGFTDASPNYGLGGSLVYSF